MVNYSYLADGTKVSALDSEGDGLVYLGSLIYRKTGNAIELESAGFAGGMFVAKDAAAGGKVIVPMFHVTDHLGSVRAVVDGVSGTVVETNDYYPFGSRWDVATSLKDESNRFRYNSKEEQSSLYPLPVRNAVSHIDYGARQYDPVVGRWFAPDPLAEKYYGISPYAFCNNNPVNFVDSDGRDIYRYDDKSGTFHLYQETNDDFDQVARFRYNKETGDYELKTRKNGDIMIRMDNVEKGILSDGINILTDSQVWSTDKVSIEGFQNFIVAYSDMIGREMGGYYYSEIGGTNIKYINSGMGKNNTQTMSYPGPGIFHVQQDLYGKVVPHTNWHTHPSYADNKLEPSGEDREFKRDQSKHGLKRFIILTGGSSPIEY
ncbi:MAG: RHS repeat-associated core domain-containing protein [Bacteroidales bacterium]|nr:RHS repeat-associated core domain-containing protein [Bacteroidales bacterium]